MNEKERGYSGETMAAQYLQSKGYEIIESNFTVRGGEIDLVARDEGVVVFIEVKTRTSSSFGEGSESVNFMKKQHLSRAINRYIDEKLKRDIDYRVDIIEIELAANKLKNITHFEDIEV